MRLTVYPFADDTYMYDEALRHGPNATAMATAGAAGGIPGGAHYAVSALHHQGHWYDEPPYESDPDDFLMAGLNCGPAATIQVSVGRQCLYICVYECVCMCVHMCVRECVCSRLY